MRSATIAAVAAGLMIAGPAQAKDWEYIVNPYFLIPKMDGKGAIGPFETRIEQSPSDIFSKLNWGIMGDIEANNGEWGVNFEGIYMNLNVTDPNTRQFRTTGSQGAYTATVLRRVHEYAWVYAGIRWSDLSVRFQCDLDCTLVPPGVPIAPRDIDVSRNQSWQEGVLGFRATLPFNDKFDLTFNGDVGGIFAGSDVSVNAWPQIGWKMGEKSKLLVGYRIIYVKYESNDDGPRFVYDVATFGPTLGVEFRF